MSDERIRPWAYTELSAEEIREQVIASGLSADDVEIDGGDDSCTGARARWWTEAGREWIGALANKVQP